MRQPPDSLVHPQAIANLCDIARASPPGAFAEFGVYKGGVAWHLAKVARTQGRALHLFDTFTGIPFAGEFDSHKAGDFGDTSLEAVAAAIPDAIFSAGVFPHCVNLPLLPPMAFVHVDCDQYQSVVDAIEVFAPRLVAGGSIVFDDSGCLPAADRAIAEWEARLGYVLPLTPHAKKIWTKPGDTNVAR